MPYIFLAAILGMIAINFPRLMDMIVYLLIAPFLGFCFGGFMWGIAILFFPSFMSFSGFGTFVILGTVMWIIGLLAIRNS